MISEAVVAMIWAAISMSFFGGVGKLNEVMVAQQGNAAFVVNEISNSLLGKVGGLLALLGVVAAPITSGDTAFRSARLIVADFLKFPQGPVRNRLLVSIPIFAIGFLLTQINFGVIWRYFAWSNQTLATIVLWAVTVYLMQENKWYHVTLLPALFMTTVITTYLFFAPEGFSIPWPTALSIGLFVTMMLYILFERYRRKYRRMDLQYEIRD